MAPNPNRARPTVAPAPGPEDPRPNTGSTIASSIAGTAITSESSRTAPRRAPREDFTKFSSMRTSAVCACGAAYGLTGATGGRAGGCASALLYGSMLPLLDFPCADFSRSGGRNGTRSLAGCASAAEVGVLQPHVVLGGVIQRLD